MIRRSKPRSGKRTPTRPTGQIPAGVACGPEVPVNADPRAGAVRVNIESVSDNRPGSVQALLRAQVPSGVAGFVESSDDENGDSHLPPCLEQT